ncbi:uncharacterized protein [Dysidea avara]|uniref:uncharacterized protein n=1 Tax=Dysidea avara TaxID=196820 RepID=UPI00331696A3
MFCLLGAMNVVEPVEPVDEVGCCPRQPCCEVKSRSDFGCSGERMSKTQLLQQLDREKHEHLKIQQLEQDNLRLKQEMKGILQEMERMKVRLCKLEQSNEKPSSPVLSHTLQPQDKRQKSKYKDMEDVQGMGSQDKIGLKGFNPFDDKKLGLRSHSEPVPLITSTVVSNNELRTSRCIAIISLAAPGPKMRGVTQELNSFNVEEAPGYDIKVEEVLWLLRQRSLIEEASGYDFA